MGDGFQFRRKVPGDRVEHGAPDPSASSGQEARTTRLRANGRSEALVHVALDLPDGNAGLKLFMRLQRNCAAEASGGAVLILETIEIVAMGGVGEASAVAGHVFQRFRSVFGGLIGLFDLGLGE